MGRNSGLARLAPRAPRWGYLFRADPSNSPSKMINSSSTMTLLVQPWAGTGRAETWDCCGSFAFVALPGCFRGGEVRILLDPEIFLDGRRSAPGASGVLHPAHFSKKNHVAGAAIFGFWPKRTTWPFLFPFPWPSPSDVEQWCPRRDGSQRPSFQPRAFFRKPVKKTTPGSGALNKWGSRSSWRSSWKGTNGTASGICSDQLARLGQGSSQDALFPFETWLFPPR